MARRKQQEPEPVKVHRRDCRHCRHAIRLEQVAVDIPEYAAGALKRAAFERSLCDHEEDE